MMLRRPHPMLVVLAIASGCPTVVTDAPQSSVAHQPVLDEKDARVVRDGNDLYTKETFERAAEGPPVVAAPGSGKPDETNGVCRLYAPKLPKPECCAAEYGFDADMVRDACGLDVYLGESMHFSCGYYFHRDGNRPAWMRMSFVPEPTTKAATESHDRQLRQVSKNPTFSSTPVPGVTDAYWSSHDGFAWAFVPGWSKVRLLSWREDGCSREGVRKVIAQLAKNREPAPDAPRQGLVPKGRK